MWELEEFLFRSLTAFICVLQVTDTLQRDVVLLLHLEAERASRRDDVDW